MVASLIALQPLLPALNAGELILTANDRLRRHLLKAWAEHQQRQGLRAWRKPPVIALNHWLEQQWQQSQPNTALANTQQRLLLWEQVIANSPEGAALLQPEPLARQADAALRNLCLWQVDPASLNTPFNGGNSQQFYQWLNAFEQALQARQLQTPEQAQQQLLAAWQQGQAPRLARLWLLGFDDLPPLHRALVEQAAEQVQTPAPASAPGNRQLLRTQAPDSDTEVRAAALWSKQQLQTNPEAVIGIIVPDLGQRRTQLERIFAEVFEPAANRPEQPRYTLPFNFSAGIPLGSTPLIDSALGLLELLRDRWPLADICQRLHSPFWGQPEQELAERSLLTEQLRRLGKFELTGSDLRYHSQRLSEQLHGAQTDTTEPGSERLNRRLQRADELRHRLSASARAQHWTERFQELLDTLGWPGTRRLDSQEYQQLNQWQQLLEAFATLDATSEPLPLGQALRQLRQLAQSTPFQAQTPDSPIQILGALEGAGLHFSHCWVLGLHHRQWPPAPKPNPLLPIDLQRRLHMPNATAERELHFARSLTDNYRQCAPVVVFSSPHSDSDGEVGPSPLIRQLPETPLAQLLGDDPSPLAQYAEQLAEHQRLEVVDCARGPALPSDTPAPGGSSLFKHQAACPFNAFAQLRLGAQAPDEPVPGLSAAERGTLLHGALASLWAQLKTSAALLALDDNALAALVREHSQQALAPIRQRRPRELGPVYCALELERLQDLLTRWLHLEQQRPAFTVVATEQRRDILFGGLQLTLYIDRIDQLASGELLLIDYKTSAELQAAQWQGERPDEPQLPLYAVSQPAGVQGIAFAQLNPKALQWIGLGELSSPLPGIAPASPDWASQVAQWQQVLGQLAADYLAGDARVDFKDDKAQRYSTQLLPLNRALEREALEAFVAARQEGHAQ